MAVFYLGDIPIPLGDIPALAETGGESNEEALEQSVESLMGEIGKHIEGQLKAAAEEVEGPQAEAAGGTSSGAMATTENTEEDPEKGWVTLCVCVCWGWGGYPWD